jgi:hypothetical protein
VTRPCFIAACISGIVASTTLKERCFAGCAWAPDLGLLCPHKFTAIVISKSSGKIFFMAGTILSHQVKFFAGSTPKPAASHSERSEESLFFLLAIN